MDRRLSSFFRVFSEINGAIQDGENLDGVLGLMLRRIAEVLLASVKSASTCRRATAPTNLSTTPHLITAAHDRAVILAVIYND
jgi:hypothetical protein